VELLGGAVEYIPKRPGEPDTTFADIGKISKSLGWRAKVTFEEGVGNMLKHLDEWRDAPLWDAGSIGRATQSWFRYLGKEPGDG
jgi:UDP-glucose 4-epimerase